MNNFFLHWGRAPPNLEYQIWMQNTFSMRENDYFIQIEPIEWDSCIYLDTVSPATAAETSLYSLSPYHTYLDLTANNKSH